jgi:hypothetical protein
VDVDYSYKGLLTLPVRRDEQNNNRNEFPRPMWAGRQVDQARIGLCAWYWRTIFLNLMYIVHWHLNLYKTFLGLFLADWLEARQYTTIGIQDIVDWSPKKMFLNGNASKARGWYHLVLSYVNWWLEHCVHYLSSQKVTENWSLTYTICRIFWFKLCVHVLWDIWPPLSSHTIW